MDKKIANGDWDVVVNVKRCGVIGALSFENRGCASCLVNIIARDNFLRPGIISTSDIWFSYIAFFNRNE
jgi:hypothetical protein